MPSLCSALAPPQLPNSVLVDHCRQTPPPVDALLLLHLHAPALRRTCTCRVHTLSSTCQVAPTRHRPPPSTRGTNGGGLLGITSSFFFPSIWNRPSPCLFSPHTIHTAKSTAHTCTEYLYKYLIIHPSPPASLSPLFISPLTTYYYDVLLRRATVHRRRPDEPSSHTQLPRTCLSLRPPDTHNSNISTSSAVVIVL